MNDKVILCHNEIFNLWTRIICFGFLVFMIVLQFTTEPKMDDWIAFCFGIVAITTIWILLDGYTCIPIILTTMKSINKYRNWRLFISQDHCFYVDEEGKKFLFQIEDIEDISIKVTAGRPSREYRIISFKDKREEIWVAYDYTMSHVKELQGFLNKCREN